MDTGEVIRLLIVCFVLFLLGVIVGTKGMEQQMHKTIELCEVELPRNQTCELVAIKKDTN